jgi:hypothetical protein
MHQSAEECAGMQCDPGGQTLMLSDLEEVPK